MDFRGARNYGSFHHAHVGHENILLTSKCTWSPLLHRLPDFSFLPLMIILPVFGRYFLISLFLFSAVKIKTMDDPVTYDANKKVVHYGSLEEKEKSKSGSPAPRGSPSPSPNINVGSGETMTIEESVSSKTRNELIEEFERKKRSRHVVVSTDDGEVKKHLRQVKLSSAYLMI